MILFNNTVQYSNLSRMNMLASRGLNSETVMDALQSGSAEMQAANKQSKQFTWKKFASISIAVCLVTVLHLATAPGPQHPVNSNRKLSAPSGSSENVSSTAYLSGNISESIPAVYTLCVCNPTKTRVSMSVHVITSTISVTLTTGKVWNSQPCACLGANSLAPYATQGQALSCRYNVDQYTLPCQGARRFYYDRNSGLAGRYVCSGSPPVCRYSVFCRQPSCVQYP